MLFLRVFLLLVLATGAIAQIDPDPDGFGIYFDYGASQVSVAAPEGTESITAYLVLTNPSVQGNLTHWSASVWTFLDEPGYAAIFGSPYNGYNLETNMPGSEHWVFEVSVYPDHPATEITMLAHLTILPYVFDEPINLYVGAGYESAGYGTDAGGAYFHPSSGGWDLPVAVINGTAPVAVDVESWGMLKTLYR
jgi:hypothetical protein